MKCQHLCGCGKRHREVWGLCLYLARHRGAGQGLGGGAALERCGPLKSSLSSELPQIQALERSMHPLVPLHLECGPWPSSLNFPILAIGRAKVGSQAAGFPMGRLPSYNSGLLETLNPNGRPDAPGQEAAPARISLSGGAAMTHSLPLP